MKTLEDEWYIIIKAYKISIFEILRELFVLSHITCCAILHVESTDSMISMNIMHNQ